ncbi:multiple inositol polyphosphate phosphatase 1-like isoform X2 [Cimex lectularius]|nr:multiple inositol polyphosphate phosphatase 1-like isoform X2 [Cimex lectularius]XP_024081964.1 multiple inositol polyphosphate phosphatase 1-like isoform X2 [Cimex lectularius]
MLAIWFLVAALLLGGIRSAQDDTYYCLAEDNERYEYFGELTSYENVRNQRLPTKLPKCTPVALWSFISNGATYPDTSDYNSIALMQLQQGIILNNSEKRNKLCHEDFDAIQNWTDGLRNWPPETLEPKYKSFINNLGQIYVNRYPEIFKSAYEEIFVRISPRKNSKETYEEFKNGMNKAGFNVSTIYESVTPVAPVTTNCSQWDQSQLAKANEKRDEFRRGPEVSQMLKEINERLGFPKFGGLAMSDIEAMYKMCRLDRMFSNLTDSPWCAAFKPEHLKVLEYDEDLYSFYLSGYGNPLVDDMACPLLKNLMETLYNNTVNGTSPQSVLYFGDVTTLRYILTGLGIVQDDDGRGLSPKPGPLLNERQWRLSVISPPLANLAVVLYKCTFGVNYQLMFYLNDHPVDYKGCKVGLCNWNDIYNSFQTAIKSESCDREVVCSESSSAPVGYSTSLAWLVLVISAVIY